MTLAAPGRLRAQEGRVEAEAVRLPFAISFALHIAIALWEVFSAAPAKCSIVSSAPTPIRAENLHDRHCDVDTLHEIPSLRFRGGALRSRRARRSQQAQRRMTRIRKTSAF